MIATIVLVALSFGMPSPAHACNPSHIELKQPVHVDATTRQAIQAMPMVKVTSIHARPLSVYDEDTRTYNGIAPDVFCFIANRIGLSFTFVRHPDQTLEDRLRAVQTGDIDVFLPLSYKPERAARGMFTHPYLRSYYVAVGDQNRRLDIASLPDLARYRVGYIRGTALADLLKRIVPEDRLVGYDFPEVDIRRIYLNVVNGKTDLFVTNRDVFISDRYQFELFDLKPVFTFRNYPRDYRFYFTRNARNRLLIRTFNRYLDNIDTYGSVTAHQKGEKELIDKYVSQSRRRISLMAGIAVAAVLVTLFAVMLWQYRKLNRKLLARNRKIQSQWQRLEAANRQLSILSTTDPLTQLANRRRLDASLKQHADNPVPALPLSLIMLDVDHFKAVNDRFGHTTGDNYLRSVADIIKQHVTRETDLTVRFGGEEMACLLANTTAQEATAVAEKIRTDVVRKHLANPAGDQGLLTVSLGIATAESTDDDIHLLIARADRALYTAKTDGRNCTRQDQSVAPP